MDDVIEFVARMDDQASGVARELRSTMERVGGPVDAITADADLDADEFFRGLDQLVEQTDAATSEVAGSLAASGQDGGRRWSDGAVEGLSGFAAKAGPVMAAAGVALAAALGASVAGAISLDATTDRMSVQLGVSATEAGRIGDVAGDLYAQAWGDSTQEVTDAVAAAYSSIDELATGSSAELEDATRKTLAFADAFETDVSRAAQVAGQVVRTGLAGDADEAFDLLTAASQRVPAAIRGDLLDAVDEYGPFFASLGMSGEQAFEALVAGADQGMYGLDKTGDALKELTIRATDMSASSVAAYEAAGLNAEEMAAAFLAGGDTASGALQRLTAGLLGIEDPTARANAAIGLFGTPLEDLGVNGIPAFLEGLAGTGSALDDFAGSADAAVETMGDNAATNLESFKRQATGLAVEVLGGKLLPAVEDIAETLATQLGPTVQAVAGWMSEHGQIVGLLASHLGGAVAATLAVVGALKAWAVVQALMNVLLTANPIGLIIVAIGALIGVIVYIATQTTWFQDIWSAVWGWIQSVAAGVADWWTNTLVPTIRDGLIAVGAFVLQLAAWFRERWDAIVGFVKAAVALVLAVLQVYVGWWQAAVAAAMGAIRATLSWFAGLPALVRGWWDAAVGAVTDAAGRLVGAVRSVVDRVVETVSGVVGTMLRIGGDIIQGIVDGIRGAIGRVTQAARDIANSVSGPVKKLLGIASPSRLMRYYGQMTGEGLVDGLAGEERAVAAQAEQLAAAVAAPLNAVGPSLNMTVQAPSQTVTQVVTIRHEVTSPDMSVREYDARELARIIATDPRAAAVLESAVRSAARVRDSRTLTAAN